MGSKSHVNDTQGSLFVLERPMILTTLMVGNSRVGQTSFINDTTVTTISMGLMSNVDDTQGKFTLVSDRRVM